MPFVGMPESSLVGRGPQRRIRIYKGTGCYFVNNFRGELPIIYYLYMLYRKLYY